MKAIKLNKKEVLQALSLEVRKQCEERAEAIDKEAEVLSDEIQKYLTKNLGRLQSAISVESYGGRVSLSIDIDSKKISKAIKAKLAKSEKLDSEKRNLRHRYYIESLLNARLVEAAGDREWIVSLATDITKSIGAG